jgi:Ni/Fe-hydrogenase subunit HybB-like protein
MGYGAVVVLTNILKYAWNGQADQRVLAGLSKVNAYLLLAYAVLRVGDILVKGRANLLVAFGDWHLYVFLVEMALFVVPAVMFLSEGVQRNRGKLFAAALMSLWAGALWRVDAYLTAYNGGQGFEYFPSLGELVVTVGMAALGVSVFLAVARLFPVVAVVERPQSATRVGAGISAAAH